MKHTKSSLATVMSYCFIIVSTLTYSVLGDSPSLDDLISPENCPPPLRVKQNDYDDDSQNCLNGCCLACPFIDNFYEENKIKKTFQIFAVLGIISFFLMIVLAIFFVTLPSQRQNPITKQILLPLTLSVIYFEGSEFFTINQQKSQCFDSITPANSHNNKYCAAQAFFTLGGGYAIACWSALLLTHLHLISVWRIEIITRKIVYFYILIIGASMTAAILPYATSSIQSTNVCFISLDAAPTYFYFLSFIYIAVAAHLSTFIYMAHITVKSNQHYSTISMASRRTSIVEAQRQITHIKTIFKMQWRALLGAILMLLIYVLNWQFYVFELRRVTSSVLTTSWVVDWLMCLKEYGSQNICASKIADHIPRYGYIFTLLFFNRTAGILIFIIFAGKRSIWLEVFNYKSPSHIDTTISFFETESGFRSSIGRFSMNDDRNRDNVSSVDESVTLAGTVSSSCGMTEIKRRSRSTSVRFSTPQRPQSNYSSPPSSPTGDKKYFISRPPSIYKASEREKSNYVSSPPPNSPAVDKKRFVSRPPSVYRTSEEGESNYVVIPESVYSTPQNSPTVDKKPPSVYRTSEEEKSNHVVIPESVYSTPQNSPTVDKNHFVSRPSSVYRTSEEEKSNHVVIPESVSSTPQNSPTVDKKHFVL